MTFLIGVVGGTASGKTSVCKGIMKALGDRRVCILSLDSFYKPLTQAQRDDVANYDFDHPGILDLMNFLCFFVIDLSFRCL